MSSCRPMDLPPRWFKTSHVLGVLLASSPLLEQAWTRCLRANAGSASFIIDRSNAAVFIAFSRAQAVASPSSLGRGFFEPISLYSSTYELFAPLGRAEEDSGGKPQPVLLQADALRLFMSLSEKNMKTYVCFTCKQASSAGSIADCKGIRILAMASLFIVVFVHAPYEEEAQCVALCKSDKMFAVASKDIYGYFNFCGTKVLEELRLTMDQFIDLCILSGCDYCDSIKGLHGNYDALNMHEYACGEDRPCSEYHQGQWYSKCRSTQGDPPHGQDKFVQVAGGSACTLDPVQHIRAKYGDYFGITVARYPKAHPDMIQGDEGATLEAYNSDLAYLKRKPPPPEAERSGADPPPMHLCPSTLCPFFPCRGDPQIVPTIAEGSRSRALVLGSQPVRFGDDWVRFATLMYDPFCKSQTSPHCILRRECITAIGARTRSVSLLALIRVRFGDDWVRFATLMYDPFCKSQTSPHCILRRECIAAIGARTRSVSLLALIRSVTLQNRSVALQHRSVALSLYNIDLPALLLCNTDLSLCNTDLSLSNADLSLCNTDMPALSLYNTDMPALPLCNTDLSALSICLSVALQRRSARPVARQYRPTT
ncbi:hypothetical protein ZIOFF_010444 [Zingiber officinale]|uniref:Methylenetetrahydrofolate reductase n=1 Tax=Zingiber officinale TaxID=94328 RepID=A0A8J5HPH5_ZINOF|nr:hypothetical protein ZIOFF_010444 [Zingiber officinale]